MKEAKEPEIKLFGRKIVLPENGGNSTSKYSGESSGSGGGGGVCDRYSGESRAEGNEEKADGVKMLRAEEDEVSETWETNLQEINQSSVASAEESQNPKTKSESDENPATPTGEEDPISEDHSESENNATNGQQRMLKKPDKILPCPRCSSMDTKFCYYNNYNVSQPRHFCKSCQRYWTAGGTMRNVPVGAGRRKTKNSASYFRHVAISETLSASRTDGSNGLNLPAVEPSGVVLSFGTDSPMCESAASVLNLDDKRVQHGVRTNEEFNGIDSSSKNVPQAPVFQNLNGFPSVVPFVPGVPWPFPWNSYLPLPALYPMPLYPAAPYWNCALPNTWPFPWIPVTSPSANQNSPSVASGSPLGKHSRNGELINPNKTECKEDKEPRKSESTIVVPKTLRIDDPEEASKSSIWETLGIKCDSVSGKGLFEALQPNCSEKKNKVPVTTSRALLANPAALSRSITFQEAA